MRIPAKEPFVIITDFFIFRNLLSKTFGLSAAAYNLLLRQLTNENLCEEPLTQDKEENRRNMRIFQGQYRTKIVRQMRSQIFCQIA